MFCGYFCFSKTESSLSDDTKNVLFTLRNKSCSLIKTDIHVLRIMALTVLADYFKMVDLNLA